jgi:hypothetical protein
MPGTLRTASGQIFASRSPAPMLVSPSLLQIGCDLGEPFVLCDADRARESGLLANAALDHRPRAQFLFPVPNLRKPTLDLNEIRRCV